MSNKVKKRLVNQSYEINVIWRHICESALLDFLGVSRDRVTCAIQQIKGNFILNRKGLVNLCDWMNRFEAV